MLVDSITLISFFIQDTIFGVDVVNGYVRLGELSNISLFHSKVFDICFCLF